MIYNCNRKQLMKEAAKYRDELFALKEAFKKKFG